MSNNHHVVPVRRDTHDAHWQALDAALEEGAICVECGVRYHNRRWMRDNGAKPKREPSGRSEGGSGAHRVLCPACRKAESRDPGGIVTLRGGYWQAHREEIQNLLRNEEKKAMGTNPVERILSMEEGDGQLVIQTTHEKLAQRLGRAVHKACHGEVEYEWSADTKLARVEWSREA